MPNLEKEVANYQIELFQLLGEFFGRATGVQPKDFSTIAGFRDELRKQSSLIAHRGEDAYAWADRELRKFYAEKGLGMFRLASRIGGLKLVLGGSSRFRGSQLAATSGSLLYADTILIPDPVAPWLEKERTEEKFRHVLMLQAVHALLHLRPIVDAELPHCPVLVFPSWEKVLEENDPQTFAGIMQLIADVLAKHVDSGITSMADASAFIQKHPDQFLQAVERSKLLVAPGGPVGEPLVEAVARYDKEARTWRTSEWLDPYQRLSLPGKVLNALSERLTPQFHLLENSEELKAHPLVCIEQQAHYFKLVAQVNSDRLERVGLLEEKTMAMIEGLGSDRLAWLSGVPIEGLVELRRNNENEAFRKRMAAAIGNLHEAALEDTDRVAAEICREIDSGIADHNRLVEEIHKKYVDKTIKLFGAGVVSGISVLVPALAPYLGPTLPLALAGKAALDLWDRSAEMKRQSKSLMGVLAIARSAED